MGEDGSDLGGTVTATVWHAPREAGGSHHTPRQRRTGGGRAGGTGASRVRLIPIRQKISIMSLTERRMDVSCRGMEVPSEEFNRLGQESLAARLRSVEMVVELSSP